MKLIVRKRDSLPVWLQRIEVAERKGIGHPDTICDGIAEQVCVALCRYYLDRFGIILHHNVDKVLLCAGAAKSCFGGGEILHPIEIYLGGRATMEYQGERIPLHDIAENACRTWLEIHLPQLNSEQDVRIIPRIRPTSKDLTVLFQSAGSSAASNDTSCGAGFAPLSDLEKAVLEVERTLNSFEIKGKHPAIGGDIKVFGSRIDDQIHLTISCAFVGRFISDIHEYIRNKEIVSQLAVETVHRITRLEVTTTVNAGDDLKTGNVFVTVTGTSAEAGDDGEAGRGNRACGLITPYRAMTMEAVAGKNPVTHVGKIYNLLAMRIAGLIVSQIPGIIDAQCVLVSSIGQPVRDPEIADVCVIAGDHGVSPAHLTQVDDIVHDQLDRIAALRDDLLAERVRLY